VSSRMTGKTDGPMALGRAMSLLRLLSNHADGLNLSTIATTLDVPKSSLLSTLNGLTEQGYLARKGSLYFIGEETWSLASALTAGRSLRQVARPILERSVAECGETVLLAELNSDKQGFAYIDFVESSKSIRFCAKIGEQRPLYPTSCGRLFLAYLSEQERDAYFKSVKLKPTSSSTLVVRSKIEQVLEKIRSTGISTTMGNYSDDEAGFSAPIRNSANNVVAGLTVGVPLYRGKREPELFSRIVIHGAKAISALLGYREEIAVEPAARKPNRVDGGARRQIADAKA
jgi:DNA-binding IclR family transcriptional regulator